MLLRDALDSFNMWLTTLLLGMAVLQLTRKIPRLLPSGHAGLGIASSGPGIRQLTDLFHSGENRNGGK